MCVKGGAVIKKKKEGNGRERDIETKGERVEGRREDEEQSCKEKWGLRD